jgi:hypothetical protein
MRIPIPMTVLIGMATIVQSAMAFQGAGLIAIGQGSGTMSSTHYQSMGWIGPVTGYWEPDGRQGGISLGGFQIRKASPVPNQAPRKQVLQGSLCGQSGASGFHGNGVPAQKQNHRIVLMKTCKPTITLDRR